MTEKSKQTPPVKTAPWGTSDPAIRQTISEGKIPKNDVVDLKRRLK